MVEQCARCDVIKTNLIRLRIVWNVERVSSCWAIDLRSSQCRCIVRDRAESVDSRSWSNVHGSRPHVAQLARWQLDLVELQILIACCAPNTLILATQSRDTHQIATSLCHMMRAFSTFYLVVVCWDNLLSWHQLDNRSLLDISCQCSLWQNNVCQC